jgi:alpha-1,2-mannosyltransferase
MHSLRARVSALSPLTRRLALFAVANIVLVNLLVVVLPTQNREEFALHTALRFLLFRASGDSWQPMSAAWAYLRTSPGQSVYDHVYTGLGLKFQYPLTSLFPIEVLQKLRGGDVVRYGPLNLVSWFSVWGTALFVALIFHHSLREHVDTRQRDAVSRGDVVARSVIVILLTITFYPIVKAFTLGQIQTWLDFLFALMLWLWMKGHTAPSGAVAGLICIVKPTLGVLVLWGAVRRRWGFTFALVGVVGTAWLASLALYGFDQNHAFVSFMRFISRRGESYWANQSINGVMNRLLHNGPNADLDALIYPPFNPVVYVTTLVSTALLIGFALLWRREDHAAAGEFDLMIAAVTFTIASPIAWEHHYGILMPIYAALLPALLRWRVLGGATIAWLGGSYVLTSNLFYGTRYLADTPFTPLQSYVLAGGLIALVLLYLVRRAAAEEQAACVEVGSVATGTALAAEPLAAGR